MRRRHLGAVACLALVAGGAGTVAAAESQSPARPAPVERVHRFYVEGPSADYSGDSGGLSSGPPLVWDVPGEGSRTAVVEVSFQYRTRGDGPFVVVLSVRAVDGERVAVRPEELTLAAADEGTSTTVRFLVPDLPAGHTYQAEVAVNSVFPGRGINLIRTRKVLMTVESTSG